MFLNKKKKNVRKRRYSPGGFLFFCLGVITGFFLITGIVLFLTVKSNDGINVYVNRQRLIEVISEQIDLQVQKEFPGFIQDIKKEIPLLVETYTHDFISIGNLEIGGYAINLPAQFIEEMENDLRDDINNYILEVMDQLEKEEFVQELSKGITDEVLKTLFADLNGQVIRIFLTKRYFVPVIVWLS